MAVEFGKDPHAKIIEALMARKDKKYKPPPKPSSKLVVKPRKDSLYIGAKLRF